LLPTHPQKKRTYFDVAWAVLLILCQQYAQDNYEIIFDANLKNKKPAKNLYKKPQH
jgi:hypothetical protein